MPAKEKKLMCLAQCEIEYCGVGTSMYLHNEFLGRSSRRKDLSNSEAMIVGFADRNCEIPRIWS